MARHDSHPAARTWLPSDSALWETCRILSDTRNGRTPASRVPTCFPLAPGEQALACGEAGIDEFRAAGDGQWASATTLVAGSGSFGLALGAASLAATVIGNANRRARAEADARPAWRPTASGTLTVTTHAFYLQSATGLLRWGWENIDLMGIAQYNCAVLQGRAATGPTTWRLIGPWSELAFVLWALARHPGHPQLADESWLPANWVAWATEQGYPPPLSRAAIPSAEPGPPR